jgi:tetratricopeptide (TPR) repeat protein
MAGVAGDGQAGTNGHGADANGWLARYQGRLVVALCAALAVIIVALGLLVDRVSRIDHRTALNELSADRLVAFGDRLAADGDVEAAVTAYTRALALGPRDDVETRLTAGRLRMIAENPDLLDPKGLAGLDFDRKWLLQADPKAFVGLGLVIEGQIALSAGDLGAAERKFNEVAADDTVGGAARLGLAMVFAARGDEAKARDGFAAAAERLPRSTYAQIGYGDRILADDPDKAEAAFLAALKVRDVASAHRGLARIHVARKDARGTIDELRKAVALDPKDVEGRANLGALLAAAGALEDARSVLESALAIRDDVPSLEQLLGVLFSMGRYDAVIRVSESYRDRQVSSPVATLHVARALEAAQNMVEAVGTYEQVEHDVKAMGTRLDPGTAKQVLDEASAGLKRLSTGDPFQPRPGPGAPSAP